MSASSSRAVATTTGTALTARSIRSASYPSRPGRPEIENYQVRRCRHDLLESVHGSTRAGNGVAPLGQRADERMPDRRVVFNEEQLRHNY